MCGIFGFITRQGQGPEIARLRRLALITQSRGAHAFGLAWLDADGRIQTFKRPGPASACLDDLDRCRDAVAMVGHCRYATHGSPQDNRNNHPHPAGAGQIVHNGVVLNHDILAHRFGLQMSSECDSEVIGLLLARGVGSILQRTVWMANLIQGDFALLGLWRRPARLLIARRGRPLHVGHGGGGSYFASLSDGLPGRARQVPEGGIHLASFEGDAAQVNTMKMIE